MSGIAAVLNLDGSAVPISEVERMANVLKPFGPDRQKTLIVRNAAFAFCLHHLTPEDAFERQPILVADRFVMLFDGRIDNRAELGEALGIAANELRLSPDSMIAFRLFDRWGEDGFERIVGDFAIILMDFQDGRLICARDPMGMRTLHYHRSAERFAVATAPEALFALSWVPRVLIKDQVVNMLIQHVVDEEATFYREINRVLPGRIVRVGDASFSKARFWDPEKIADVRFKNDDDYVDSLQDLLDVAVKASLRASCTPCATLTGGLDSSTIAIIAGDMLSEKGDKLNTFTAVPEAGFVRKEMRGVYFDETPYVRQIAETNSNIIPHFIPPRKGFLIDQIVEQIRVTGAQGLGVLNGLWMRDILVAARSLGHNVMLTGEMGNLTMSHDGAFLFAELLVTGRWLRLIGEIRASGHKWKYHLRNGTIAPNIPAPIFRRYKKWRRGKHPPWHPYAAVNPDFAVRSGVFDRVTRGVWPYDAPPPRNGRRAKINSLPCYGGFADSLATMRAKMGVDVRAPAYDRRIVEFCIGIPEDQYLYKGCDRWLIRRAMKGRLPNAVLYNKKLGLQAADWFPRLSRERHRIAAEVKRLRENSNVASILDLERLTALLNDWPDREPSVFGAEASPWRVALVAALGAAHFIEDVTGSNFGR